MLKVQAVSVFFMKFRFNSRVIRDSEAPFIFLRAISFLFVLATNVEKEKIPIPPIRIAMIVKIVIILTVAMS